jgi:hypothetical protein
MTTENRAGKRDSPEHSRGHDLRRCHQTMTAWDVSTEVCAFPRVALYVTVRGVYPPVHANDDALLPRLVGRPRPGPK